MGDGKGGEGEESKVMEGGGMERKEAKEMLDEERGGCVNKGKTPS